jgi:hypothetical protein
MMTVWMEKKNEKHIIATKPQQFLCSAKTLSNHVAAATATWKQVVDINTNKYTATVHNVQIFVNRNDDDYGFFYLNKEFLGSISRLNILN